MITTYAFFTQKWISKKLNKSYKIKTDGSELRGRTRRASELFTCSTTVKFVNALNNLPLKLSLLLIVIKGSASSNYVYRISNPTMEEICYTLYTQVKRRMSLSPTYTYNQNVDINLYVCVVMACP